MVYITGDIHGSIDFLHRRGMNKLRRGDTLVVLGDFGFFWNGSAEEKKSLDILSGKKYNILFLDGTHENFDLIDALPDDTFCGGGVGKYSENVMHARRGEIFEIDGLKLFCLGGGEAPDEELRRASGTFYESSIPSRAELEHANSRLAEFDFSVDYILTHEPPGRVLNFIDKTADTDSFLHKSLDSILLSVRYKRWYFGSRHADREATEELVSVYKSVIRLD